MSSFFFLYAQHFHPVSFVRVSALILMVIGTCATAGNSDDFTETDYHNLAHSRENGLVCRTAEYEKFAEFESVLTKAGVSLNWALVVSRCSVHHADAGMMAPYAHKIVYGGAYVASHFAGILDYLNSIPSEERALLFSHILSGGYAEESLIEIFLRMIQEGDGRKIVLVRTAKRVCRAIEFWNYDDVLGHYLYDPIRGCSHPAIGFEPKR